MKGKKRQEKKDQIWCPYCDEEIASSQLPYCQPCRVTDFHCPQCGKTVPRQHTICPNCGAEMRTKST